MFSFDERDFMILCTIRDIALYLGFDDVGSTVRAPLVGEVVTGNAGDVPIKVLGYRVSLTRPIAAAELDLAPA